MDDSILPTILKNVGKNGRVIPVKVEVFLEGVAQTSTQIASGALTISVNLMPSCSSTASDTVETYADAGASNGNTNQFRWDGNSWIYNLDTTQVKMTNNPCYQLDVLLNGVKLSTQRVAVFQPTK